MEPQLPTSIGDKLTTLLRSPEPSPSAGRTLHHIERKTYSTVKKTSPPFKFALSNASVIILSVANGILPLNKRSFFKLLCNGSTEGH
jgi:hypothetical protein